MSEVSVARDIVTQAKLLEINGQYTFAELRMNKYSGGFCFAVDMKSENGGDNVKTYPSLVSALNRLGKRGFVGPDNDVVTEIVDWYTSARGCRSNEVKEKTFIFRKQTR